LWETASKSEAHKLEYATLRTVTEYIREAGAEVIEGTDFPSAEEIIPPTGWDW
jgi:amidase